MNRSAMDSDGVGDTKWSNKASRLGPLLAVADACRQQPGQTAGHKQPMRWAGDRRNGLGGSRVGSSWPRSVMAIGRIFPG